uniref:Ovule protein n=1 Tax=Brugia timori TaxID=42155 RepID=A0A0R3QCN3_9BILA
LRLIDFLSGFLTFWATHRFCKVIFKGTKRRGKDERKDEDEGIVDVSVHCFFYIFLFIVFSAVCYFVKILKCRRLSDKRIIILELKLATSIFM